MDNASKALIMVGAILIAVMLISLGVFLFSYAREQAENQTQVMDATVVAAFNEQFLSYCGENIKGTSLKSLISKVKASNAQNTEFPVSIMVAGTTEATTGYTVDTTATYKVVESYAEDGHIYSISFWKNE